MLKKRTVKLLCWVRETLAVKNKQRKKHESYHEVFSSKKRHADTRSVFGRPLLRSLNPRFPPISALPSLLSPFLHLLLPFHLLHPSSLPTLSYLSLSLCLWMRLSFILGGAREAMTCHLWNTCYVPVTVLATPTRVISLNRPHSHRAATLPTVWPSAVSLSETTQLIRSLSDFTRYTT